MTEERIRARCEHCGVTLSLKDKWAGRKIKCVKCGEPVQVPGTSSLSAAENKKPSAKPASSGGILKYSAAILVLSLVSVFFFYEQLHEYFVPGVSQENIEAHDAASLSDAVLDTLDLTTRERSQLTDALLFFRKNGFPESLPISEPSLAQQRNINRIYRRKVERIKKQLRGTENILRGSKRLIFAGIPPRDLIEAYVLTNRMRYFKLWKRMWLLKINGKPGILNSGPVSEFLAQFSAWKNIGLPDHPEAAPFLGSAMQTLKKKTAVLRSRSRVGDVLLSSYYFHGTAFGTGIEKKALQRLLSSEKPPISDLGVWAENVRYLMKYLTLMRKAENPVSMEIMTYAERKCQTLGFLLEPDGCLPQLRGVQKRTNYRETLFRASRLFDRDDFRFIAYGGLMMPRACPPDSVSAVLKEVDLCVMRSTWNICYHIKKRNDQWLGDESTSVTVDLKTGDISVFGYNHPQLVLRPSSVGLLPEKTAFTPGEEVDHLHLETASVSRDIYFLRKYNTCILKENALKEPPVGENEFHLYRSEVRKITERDIITEHPPRIRAKHNRYMPNKQPGLVRVFSTADTFSTGKVTPQLSGCFWKATASGAGNNRETVITALPYKRGMYPQRLHVIYRIEPASDGLYTVRVTDQPDIIDKKVCTFSIKNNKIEFLN